MRKNQTTEKPSNFFQTLKSPLVLLSYSVAFYKGQDLGKRVGRQK